MILSCKIQNLGLKNLDWNLCSSCYRMIWGLYGLVNLWFITDNKLQAKHAKLCFYAYYLYIICSYTFYIELIKQIKNSNFYFQKKRFLPLVIPNTRIYRLTLVTLGLNNWSFSFPLINLDRANVLFVISFKFSLHCYFILKLITNF